MIIAKAKLKGFRDFVTGLKLMLFIPITEITDDLRLNVTQALNTDGYLTFSPDRLKAEVEEIMKNRKIGATQEGKSKSELMRGALYKYWQAGYRGDKTFEEFYNEKMDNFITKINQTVAQIEAENLDSFYNKR